ncbi:ATP-binding protein [Pseudonocardia broussonetiae]|uniref:AAA family ATPase n=1 Tax=Pseudonocardia broussonetiae TaxID=2736640 RepID=A0A6M6JJR7_9PSEU|nr:AAA family ATPase [Pseudonocardia broussonetiae]QJY47403.1 AAA family ATPase [Pseudonocardia broussonetiae]
MAFVGRARALSRLLAAVEEAEGGCARLVLVGGEAGMGKTTLLTEVAGRSGLRVGWGTCADADRLPALWPWTTALRGLTTGLDPAAVSALAHPDAAELARLLPELAAGGAVTDPAGSADDARLRLFDAVARFLERLARHAPVLLVLDDLQWADESTLALLQFVTRVYRPVPLVVVVAYRHDELGPGAGRAVAELVRSGDPVQLSGLSAAEVSELVTGVIGDAGAQRWAAEVHRRTSGHPFLARQLAELLADPTRPPDAVPPVAHELLARRVDRLSPGGRALIEAAALGGGPLLPDVLAEVCGMPAAAVASFVEEGVREGVLVRDTHGGRPRLTHDLFREALAARLDVAARMELHRRTADALEHRHRRGAAVVAAELARHCAAAVPLEGGERAVVWARAAALADSARLAYGEAAAHLARARRALDDAGVAGEVAVDLLVEEAAARARSGERGARALLDDAWARATALGDPERLGAVALGVQRLGARFAMARDAVVAMLETARAALDGTGSALEAQLTASLARELHHSVPAHRARARPLSERAIELARRRGDPATLAACLLARHDVLWTPGRAAERVGLAREIADLAARTGDAERHAEGLLLLANALLEEGSPAFRAALADYLAVTDGFGQPRHDYLALTRRGALALIDGRLDEADRLIGEASTLGERIGEPDTGNVRMSQLLGLVRARRDPDRLRATAAEAIRWWVGVPSHAYAVAAGLLAMAGEPGDIEAARRALDTVVALDEWRSDHSYLWSVFVGGMATAAVRLGDTQVCRQLLTELEPVAGSCGVNGALVCFVGSNAHWAGVLAGALGRPDDARRLLTRALTVHRRLGAHDWAAETERELAGLDTAPAQAVADAELRRDGELWRVRHRDVTAHLPDLKGLADLAALLARPGRDVHVLELAGAGNRERDSGTLLDATARATYRHRLAELDEDLADARADHDAGRAQQLDVQRDALIAELGRAAGLGGRGRALGTSTTERARKAVTARLRDAIGRIASVHPGLGAHLDRAVVTGTVCRYEPADPCTWQL